MTTTGAGAPRRGGFLVLATDLSHRGGIGAYTGMFLGALREVRADDPIHLLTLNHDPDAPLPARSTITHQPRPRRFAVESIRQALTRRPDEVVVTHLHLLPLGLLAARLTGARLTVTLHGYEVWLTRRRLLRVLGNRADRMVAVSRNTAERADRFFYRWVPRRYGSILLVPPAVDPATYAPTPGARRRWRDAQGFADTDTVLLTVARLDPAEQGKGHDRVLRALHTLVPEHPGLRYVITGQGDDRPRLETLVAALGLQDHVRFSGFVADLADGYAGADLFVMPSYQEGFGIVFIEALASGLPVVAGGIDGSVEALRYGETGFLCDPLDPASVIDALRTGLYRLGEADPRTDPARLRATTIEAFSPEAMAERVAHVIAR